MEKQEVMDEVRKIVRKELEKEKESIKSSLYFETISELRKQIKWWIFEYYEESEEEHLKKYSDRDTKNTITNNVKEELKKIFEVEADMHISMVYAVPRKKEMPRYKFREMVEYAKEKGVEVDALSKREKRKFIVLEDQE